MVTCLAVANAVELLICLLKN